MQPCPLPWPPAGCVQRNAAAEGAHLQAGPCSTLWLRADDSVMPRGSSKQNRISLAVCDLKAQRLDKVQPH